jgi:hypothetical protein
MKNAEELIAIVMISETAEYRRLRGRENPAVEYR